MLLAALLAAVGGPKVVNDAILNAIPAADDAKIWQGRAVGHLIADLEAERARIAEPARPAVILDELRPLIEHRVRELHRAFEASPEDCRAALRGLLAGKLRVREDAERGFAVEGFLECPVQQDRGRRATAGAVAVVGPVVVVEAQEAVEGALELREMGEVAAAELHTPVLVEDRALQALDEAVGPGVGPRGASTSGAAGRSGWRGRRPAASRAESRAVPGPRDPGATSSFARRASRS
jgi:hypothetical protein